MCLLRLIPSLKMPRYRLDRESETVSRYSTTLGVCYHSSTLLKVEGDKIYGSNNGVSGVKKWAESEIWDEQGKLTSEAAPYTKSKSILKANHPVRIFKYN